MQNFLGMINLILAQTEQEKRLTILYVSLFVFLLVFLVIDSDGQKKWISNGPLKKITWVLLIVGLVALAVLYFVL